MKIYYSAASPFVRKVLVCAAELGVTIEHSPAQVGPVARSATVVADNPLGQLPTFFADDGTVLYDSRVICEFLDDHAGGGRLFPKSGAARWQSLVEQSLADGLLDAALLARYETILRPDDRKWPDWIAGQMDKVRCACDRMEQWAPSLGGRVDIGTIAIGCALGWLDFRYADYGWRTGRPALAAWFDPFAARTSMASTTPHA